jgi:diadenosine tetraphosphate (Ap4A) HIT family hydrolase
MNGDLPGFIPYTDEHCVVVMSINPIAPGHCLIIPRREVDQWTDLDDDLARHLMSVARRIGRVMRERFSCVRVGLVVAGFEVPHCHLHVIPASTMADLDFSRASSAVDNEELARHCAIIADALL